MSDRGVFAVDRGIWSDPDFADEAFSEREAFLWLLGEAAWRPTRARIGSAVVDLARGQCAFSTRFMGLKWKWSEARVRRFLGRLQKSDIIDASADAHATRITIKKYDRFQRVSLPSDAQDDAEPTRSRRTDDAPATQQRRKEEDRENISSSLRSEPRIRRTRPARCRVDPSWQLGPDEIATALRRGLSADWAASDWPNFIDHHRKLGSEFVDWPAAWGTWCGNAVKFAVRDLQRARPPPGPRITGATAAAMNRATRTSGAEHVRTLDLDPHPFPVRREQAREPSDAVDRGSGSDGGDEGGRHRSQPGTLCDFPGRRANG